jgi:uncharacterized protein YdeI (BOF family)
MNHLKYLFLFVGLAILAACSDSDVGGLIDDANQANFSATIGELKTRVTDNSWDAGDAIGVFALKAGNPLSDAAIFDEKQNVKYTTSGNAAFTAVGAPINFPEKGNLDFVSYYPYNTVITDYKYNIDVSTQSNLAAIDLLYSNNAKGESKDINNVDLDFDHVLSKLVFNLELGSDLTSLEGLVVSINDIIVDGELALANGAVAIGTTKKNITPNVNIAEGNKLATATAIVVPGQNLQDVEIVFTLGEKKFRWSPTPQELASSMEYAYKLILTLDSSGMPNLVPVKATISDWIDGYIGDEYIDLDPEQEETELITIEELLAKYVNNGLDTWTITEPLEIKAVVTSDKTGGNSTSPKNGYIQDEAGNALAFRVDETAHDFDMGDEITIGLSDAVISKYGGSIQLAFSTARAEVIATDVVIEPKVLTIEEALNGMYDAKLIEIKNIQFDKYTDLTYYSEVDKSITDRTLIDTNGNTIIVGTSKNATFKDELLPKGKGDIVGVMSVFFGKWQLNIRNLDDVQISEDESTRFDPPSLTIDIDRAIIAKEAGQQVIAISTNVEWTATTNASWLTINPANGNSDATLTLSASVNNAKEARIAEVTITAPNHKALSPIVITISQRGTNDGTKENPYTVSDAIALQGEKGVWVQGYIVGSVVNNRYVFSAEGATNSNIIIADNADETDQNNAVPVQLPAGASRNELNLQANSDMYKVEVIIKGDLEAYFGAAGLKNAKEYELVTP